MVNADYRTAYVNAQEVLLVVLTLSKKFDSTLNVLVVIPQLFLPLFRFERHLLSPPPSGDMNVKSDPPLLNHKLGVRLCIFKNLVGLDTQVTTPYFARLSVGLVQLLDRIFWC